MCACGRVGRACGEREIRHAARSRCYVRMSTSPDRTAMSPVTAVKIVHSEQDGLTLGELRAWRGLLRAHACLAKRLDAELEQAHGLPMTSYEVLYRLERDGLLERCSCEHDARGSYACLTGAGRDRLEAARGTHRAVVREHFFS